MKGLQWLQDPDLDVSQNINSDSIILLQLNRKISRLKVATVEANLETSDGTRVRLRISQAFSSLSLLSLCIYPVQNVIFLAVIKRGSDSDVLLT